MSKPRGHVLAFQPAGDTPIALSAVPDPAALTPGMRITHPLVGPATVAPKSAWCCWRAVSVHPDAREDGRRYCLVHGYGEPQPVPGLDELGDVPF